MLACNLRRLRLSWILLLIRLSNWGDLTSRYRLFLSILRRHLLSRWLLLRTWLRLSSLCCLLISDCFIMSHFIFSRLLILCSLKFEGFSVSHSLLMSDLLSGSFILSSLLCCEFPCFLISDSFLFSLFSSSNCPLSRLFLFFLCPLSCLLLLLLGSLSIQLCLKLRCLFRCL